MTTNEIQSIVEETVEASKDELMPGTSLVPFWFREIGDILPGWWSPARDIAIRSFWKDEGPLSGLMVKSAVKLSSIPIRIVARDPTVASHRMQAERYTYQLTHASEFGEGLQATIDRFVEDYLGQDNGGMMELMDGSKAEDKHRSIRGPVLAVRHLDAAFCTRTGDPLYPINYMSPSGIHKLHMSRVVYLSQMSTSIRSMNGVGFCSVSRSAAIAQNMIDSVNYKLEKLGSRPQSQILFGKMINAKTIMKTMLVAERMMDDLGLRNYAQTIALGSDVPEADLKRIALNEFTPFDEEKTFYWGLVMMANAWGLEFNELFPVPGAKASDEVALQRARGMLPVKYVGDMKKILDYKLVPPHLEVIFDFQDDTKDQQRAIIEDIRARNRSRNLESGATTTRFERRKMLTDGVVSRHDFDEMNLEDGVLPDGRPVGAIFFDPVYAPLVGALTPLVAAGVDVDFAAAMSTVRLVRANVLAALGQLRGANQRTLAMQALAAIDWLESDLMSARMNGAPVDEEEGRDEEE